MAGRADLLVVVPAECRLVELIPAFLEVFACDGYLVELCFRILDRSLGVADGSVCYLDFVFGIVDGFLVLALLCRVLVLVALYDFLHALLELVYLGALLCALVEVGIYGTA